MAASRPIATFTERLCAWALIALALAAAVTAFVPGVALADDTIAAVRVGDDTRYCTTFSAVNEEVAANKGKDIEVEMTQDWDASVGMTAALTIPENTRVTLIMNGHKIDRGLANSRGWKNDGEVILVKSGGLLTVNGAAETATSHDAYVYSSLDPNAALVSKTIQGALITGGASTNSAGGIHVNKGATITLNGVTVAGCRAQKAGSSKGYGGGMSLNGGSITVNLNNSTITGCYAQEDGGGIYSDAGGASTINLKNSHIDANYAYSDGGGIDADGKGTRISGDASLDANNELHCVSTISNNECNERGGGVLSWNCDIGVSRLELKNNKAKDGGGVYAHRDKVLLDRLAISNNTASRYGGGVHFSIAGATASTYDGPSEIADCKITGNTAQRYGGVYCDDFSIEPGASSLRERERRISGATVIMDNTARDGSDFKNLCVVSSNWMYKSETFYLNEGAEIWASLDWNTGLVSRPFAKDKNCAKYLHCDQADHGFIYSNEDRCIVWVRSEYIPVVPTAKDVSAADAGNASGDGKVSADTKAGKVGTVGAGGEEGSDYNLVRGFYMHDGEKTLTAFYYSDGLFYGDPYKYNTHLGTLSWAWTISASYLNKFEEEDANGNTYYNKHAAGRQFLADIGCDDQNIYINDFMTQKPGTDSIGVTIGYKELTKADGTKTGDILVPVAIRSQGYEAEWVSNVTLGSAQQMSAKGKEAMGFASAADQAFAEVKYYLKKYGLKDEYRAGKVKFWVAGYSRGGATANLTSKRLVDMIAADECDSQVFGYTCEGAKGGTDDAEVTGNDYTCIHNMVNLVDIVPYVAPVQMGFKRYGVDHYIPGSAAGTITTTTDSVTRGGSGGPGTVTTRADNKAYYTKTTDYNNQKKLMLQQLLAMNSSMQLNDFFQPQAMDFISTSGFLHVYDEGNYDDNHIEDFVPDFLWLLQEQAATSRDEYATKAYVLSDTTYPTIQKALQDTIGSFMNGGMGGFVDEAGNIKDNISTFSFSRFLPSISNNAATPGVIDFSMAGLYFDVVGNWKKLKDGEKAAWTRNLWNALVKTGAVDKLSAEDKDNLENNFPTLINMVFNIVDVDYNYKPKDNKGHQWAKGSDESMMYLPTFMAYSDYILSCHTPDINIAWVRSYDSWFSNDVNEFSLNTKEYSVDAPTAYATLGGERAALKVQSEGENNLVGSQRITLDNENIVGEAVYYDLIDKTGEQDVALVSNQIYRGGIDLPLESGESKSYELTTYDMSYGVKSDSVTFRINLGSGQHKVIVRDLDPSSTSAGDSSGLGGASVTGQSAASGQGSGSDDGLGLAAGSVPGGLLQPMATGDLPEGYREQTYTYAEGQYAVVEAGVPATRYFKTWTVEVLDSSGNPVASADVTDALLGAAKYDVSAAFTMPAVAGAYPQGYQLRFTANYGAKVTEVVLDPTAPVTGQPLPASVPATLGKTDSQSASHNYTPAWLYETADGTVEPAAGTALPKTVYYAQVLIEQDPDHDIGFDASSVNVALATGLDSSSVEIVGQPTRNPTAGTVLVTLKFVSTQPNPEPEQPLQFGVQTYDMTTKAPIPGTGTRIYNRAHAGDSVQLTAPVIEGMAFHHWDFSGFDSGIQPPADLSKRSVIITIPEGKTSLSGDVIIAYYVPTISKVEVNLYRFDGSDSQLFVPEAGSAGPARCEMFITVGQGTEYEVNPESLNVTWSPGVPEGDRFAPLTQYVGLVKAATEGDSGGVPTISVRKKGSADEYKNIAIVEALADSYAVTFNGDSTDVALDMARYTLSKKFPETGKYVLGAVRQPDDISGVAYTDGDTAEKVSALLPAKTRILTTHGIELDAEIAWGTPTKASGDDYAAAVWTATGMVQLPDNVENSLDPPVDQTVSMTVSVNAAASAQAPSVSPASGSYLYNQVATLTTNEEGGKTYYTTDGSNPATSDTAKAYAGEEIYVNRADAPQDETGRPKLILRAYTTAADKRPSDVVEYDYVFSDIPVPKGQDAIYDGTEHIGVEGSLFYQLTIIGGAADYDEDNNVLATELGTYKVRASLPRGTDYYWQLDDGTRTQEDQIITFSIKLKTFTVVFKNDDGTVLQTEELEQGAIPTYKGAVPTKAATESATYVFKGWTPEIVAVDGDATYTATYEEVPIPAPTQKASLVFDLAGGTIDGKTSLVIVADVGDTIDIPAAPVREGYAFKYWQGSQYYPGDKYTVTGDHKFTAVWELKPAPTPASTVSPKSGVTRTGDALPPGVIAALVALALASLATGIAVANRRERM